MADVFADNRAACTDLLQRFERQTLSHFINGAAYEGSSDTTFVNHTPIDNSIIGQVAAGSDKDIDVACQAAQAAFPAWRDMPGDSRRDLLHRIADAIETNARDIALVES